MGQERNDTPRAPSVDAMRRYLLYADVAGGYIPQLVLPQKESELWTQFWYAIRRIDDCLDDPEPELSERTEEARREPDFVLALNDFITGAEPYMDARRRVFETLQTIEAERLHQSLEPAAGVRELLKLWYHKAYAPTYVGFRLLLRDTAEKDVRKLAQLVGCGLQWMDDLFDLEQDLGAGRFWLSREELQLLGMNPSQCLQHLPAITKLRETISLTYFDEAYRHAKTFRSVIDRRYATRYLEELFPIYLGGHFRVYSEGEGYEWGFLGLGLQNLPGPESLKYQVLHAWNRFSTSLPRCSADASAIERRLKTLGPCPLPLGPDVCLEVLSERESHFDNEWDDEVRDRDPLDICTTFDLPRGRHTGLADPLSAAAFELTDGLSRATQDAWVGLASKLTSENIGAHGVLRSWIEGLTEGNLRFFENLEMSSKRAHECLDPAAQRLPAGYQGRGCAKFLRLLSAELRPSRY